MNKIIIIGNLTKDVERLEMPSGSVMCKFVVATNKTINGERVAQFHTCIGWNKLAENCCKYLKKGSKVGVIGEMNYREFEDKNGVKKVVSEIGINDIEFLNEKQKENDETCPF